MKRINTILSFVFIVMLIGILIYQNSLLVSISDGFYKLQNDNQQLLSSINSIKQSNENYITELKEVENKAKQFQLKELQYISDIGSQINEINSLKETKQLLTTANYNLNNKVITLDKLAFPKIKTVRNFDTYDELMLFLRQDKTNELKYEPYVMDCEDFSLRLIQNAYERGYIMGIWVGTINGDYHAQCTAVVGNILYRIEPQNDSIVSEIRLD